MSGDPRVLPVELWYSEEIVVSHDLVTHPCAEFFYLVSNITQEGIAGPTVKKHDCEDRDGGEIHGHGGPTS